MLRLLAVACALWLAQAAQAKAVLAEVSERLELWPHVTVLADPSRVLDINDIRARLGQFTPPKSAYATLGMKKGVVWLQVPLSVHEGGAGVWILDIDYALLNQVDVYLVQDGRLVRQSAVGNLMAFEDRPLKSRSLATQLDVSVGDSVLLMRVDTGGAKILPITLNRISAFHEHALAEQLLQGALGCLAVFLVLYSLAQWASLREPLYLKYAMLVLCSATFSVHFFGIGEMYLWTDREWPQKHLAGITALLAAGATALFVEDALAGDLNAWLRRGLRAVAALHLAAAVAHAFDVIDIQTIGVLMSTTGLAPALMGLPGAVARARRGDSVGMWFIVAWTGYFVASAIMVGVVRGSVGADFWTLHSFQIGATLDMLVFMRIAVLRTTTRHREAQRAVQERDRLHSLAHSDPLTGLLNRRGLNDALTGALERATPQRVLALYVLDLDGFKAINDQHGHDVGDELLLVVAQRLRSSMRANDAVARFGGDEFVVMAEGLTDASLAAELGRKLLDAFHAPFALRQQTCRVTATIGYALAPLEAGDAASLLKAADAAMYGGKQSGKDRVDRALGSTAGAAA